MQVRALSDAAAAALQQRRYAYKEYLKTLFDEASQRAEDLAEVPLKSISIPPQYPLNSAPKSSPRYPLIPPSIAP